MKIAIQGNSTRGREVIQILESLGGINIHNYSGLSTFKHYIDSFNKIDVALHLTPDWKIYTLEEFEKEFPFKVGDKVKTVSGKIGIVIELIPGDCQPYLIKSNSGEFWCKPHILHIYQEMKEERNIILTLDKAKEWYKKGGELKEIALQAFSEKELNPLPRSWAEFCINHPVKFGETYIGTCSKFISRSVETRDSVYDRYVCPSKKSAEAHLAMIQLEQLRDCWWDDWKPNWLNGNEKKYAIKGWRDKSSIEVIYVTHAFLSFPTYELALEFQECFRDLIEKAGDLI